MHKYAISGGITWIMEQTGELTGRYTQIWDLYGIYMGFIWDLYGINDPKS